MKFVQDHLTRHHLFHAPHRWFFALLLSPFHAAEMHYQRKYHLTFRHAKKLFFFDMCLLTFIAVLSIATLFYFFYDPTIRDLVYLKVEQSTERLKTGETVKYTINYSNKSDIALESAALTFQFPTGFTPQTFEPSVDYKPENSTVELGILPPGSNADITITGILYGSPDQEYDTSVKLSYIQEGETEREFVMSRIVTAPRDTPLIVAWQSGEYALSSGNLPFQIQIENKGKEKLETLKVPLPTIAGIQYQNIKPTHGAMQGTIWNIPTLLSGTSSTLSGSINTNLSSDTKNITFEFTPTLSANNTDFPQKKFTKNIEIVHPNVVMLAQWKNNLENIRPYESGTLEITIKNNSTIEMTDVVLNIPVGNPIDLTQLTRKNIGSLKNNIFVISKIHRPALAALKPQEVVVISLEVPMTHPTQGSDVTAHLSPEVQAHFALIPGAVFTKKVTSSALKIASRLLLSGQILYYTPEGDQLGRGPLPPQVGTETKYWATFNIQNTTSKVEALEFSATLPESVVWTDKSSVSIGSDVQFNPTTRRISWSHPSVPPHTTVGINFELAFTPRATQLNTTPLILQNIAVKGTDAFTQFPLTASLKALDISLPFDSIGKNKGVKVIE